MPEKQDIERLLKEHYKIEITPRGFSMYPLFYSGRDKAIIESVDLVKLHCADVVLYRRENEGILVLHRIWKIKKEGYYMVGDQQTEIEGPLKKEQILGKMVELNRKGRKVSIYHPCYILYSNIWLLLRPFRPFIKKIIHRIKSKGKMPNE